MEQPAQTPRALDTDGVKAVGLGTVVWLAALVVALAMHRRLRAEGHLWWIAAAACGVGLGLLGLVYCVRRRRRLAKPRRVTG